MTAIAAPSKTAVWEKTDWHGETAWISLSGDVCAIVTEARSRLIYLGSADGTLNLLNAPAPQPKPDKNNPWPNQGGHRFWLGPQYRWVWPPPADWEYSPAANTSVVAGVLTLQQAHANSTYPALVRQYAWEGTSMRCTVRWKDDGHAYFGLHVVAVDAPMTLRAHLERTAAVPNGLVAARMVDPEPPVKLPHPAITIDGDYAVIRSGIQRAKLGFPLQTLRTERPKGWTLSVLPGPNSVATGEVADLGYLSQVWVGDGTADLAEIEQLTPSLKADITGYCSSTIYIEAKPPAP